MANKTVTDLKGKLPWQAKLGYGGIGLHTMGTVMFSTWQMYFYTTFAGLDILAAGTIASVGTILAAFTAPVWGYISDRLYATKIGRKYGRRRLTLAISLPGLFFNLAQFVPGLPALAYGITNCLAIMLTAGISTVQYVLPSEMSSNQQERAQLVGINQITVAVANIIVSITSTLLFSVWGQDHWTTFFWMLLIYSAASVVVLIVTICTIRERPFDETTDLAQADSNTGSGDEKVPLLKRIPLIVWNYVSAFSVKEFRNYLGMYLCQALFRSVRGAILTYFLIFVLGLQASDVSISQGVSFAFGILLVGFFMWLDSKIGGTNSYRLGALETIVVFLLMFALAKFHTSIGRAGTVTLWIVLTLALNFGITGVVNACDLHFSFMPDVDEILTGKRREAQYASINSTIDNIFYSIEKIAIAAVLAGVGFVENATSQPEPVVNALTIIFCFVPIALCFVGLFFSFRVKLNDDNRKILSAEIERLRNGGSKDDVTPEAKEVVETLTGWKYEHCWGNNRVVNFTRRIENPAK